MEINRSHLFHADSTMNQLRNAVFYLARLMEKEGNNTKTINERLRNMGRNIAKTFINYWKPIEIVNTSNLRDVLKTIYRTILSSSISIDVDSTKKLIIVRDYKCPLCRYPYDDIAIAGCEIVLGMVPEFISLINTESTDTSVVFLEPIEVNESRSLGHDICIQIFKYKIGGG